VKEKLERIQERQTEREKVVARKGRALHLVKSESAD